MNYIVAQYICTIFMQLCGKWQDKKPEAERQAMLVDFTKRIEFDKEEGYRHYQLMIYAPANYVQVWVRETWDVLPNGADDYIKGASAWQLIGDHDSGWRGQVQNFLRAYEKSIDSVREPWKMVSASQVPEKNDESRNGPFEV